MIQLIGGSGFIGSRLASLIHEIDFRIFDKNHSFSFPDKVELGDVRDLPDIQKHFKGSSALILLAAEHRDDVTPSSIYYEVNVEGVRNVVQVMREQKIQRIIFTSTVAVYGLNRVSPSESDYVEPVGDYGKSKWQAEEVLREWWQEAPNDRELVIVRPCVVFGENNQGNVYNLLKQIHSGRFLMIGSGMNYKSMAYVGNVAAFLKHLLDHPKPGYRLYNYVDKPDYNMSQLISLVKQHLSQPKFTSLYTLLNQIQLPYSIWMLAGYGFDLISSVSGKKLPISSVRVKKFCATTQFSSDKLAETEFIPPFTLIQGLERTLKSEFACN